MNVVPIAHGMTEAQYKIERDEIRATHGDTATEHKARFDQALAALFYRSSWTQEQLAKVEGCARQHIARRLLFGQFLAFAPTGANAESDTSKLTERRFRDYWSRTDPKHNDRQRFSAVLHEMAESTPAAPRRNGLGRKIVAEFGDGKWHKIETIAERVGEPPESLLDLLGVFNSRNNNYGVAICEKQRVGAKDGTWRYRIVKGGQQIDLTALTQELLPILEEMKYQGAQHRAAYSPSAVLTCAHRIEKLIEALAQPAAPSR